MALPDSCCDFVMTRLMTFLFLVPPSALAAESRHSLFCFFGFFFLLSFYFAGEYEHEDEITPRVFKRYIATSVPCCPPTRRRKVALLKKKQKRVGMLRTEEAPFF